MDKELKEKLITTLYATVMLSLTVFLFGPLQLYFTNVTEFSYYLFDIWYIFLLFSTLAAVLLTAVLLQLKSSVHCRTVSIVFMFGFLLWLQGNVIVWDYGVLDGKDIDWNNYKFYGFIDSLVWFIFLIMSFVKSKLIYRVIKKASIFLILVQMVSLVTAGFQPSDEPAWKKMALSEESKYSFSAKKNIVILVLDTFQSDIFQEIIKEEPSLQDSLIGFTYYRNSVGGFPTTYPSIPLVMTGQYYDNSIPFQEFIKTAYSSYASIPLVLRQHNFKVDLFTGKQIIYNDPKIVSNLVNSGHSINRIKETLYTYKVTMFRYAPHFLKKPFYALANSIGSEDSIEQDLEFSQKIVSDLNTTNNKPTFKLYHLRGAHPPFFLNEQLKIEQMDFNRDGYKTQAKASLQITKRFLISLQKNGIYDNTMIFIIGDHGLGVLGLKPELSGHSEKLTKIKNVKQNIVAYGTPLVLVKPFNSSGKMMTSDSPVSLSDIPKTMFAELNISTEAPGVSMLSVKESDTRERRFLGYQWINEKNAAKYLPNMSEYIINGFSWLSESWRPTYREYTSRGIRDTYPPKYQYGNVILFGREGNAEKYQGLGWGDPEHDATWTEGKSCYLFLPVRKTESDLLLVTVLSPLVSPRLSKQRVEIYVNGKQLGRWDVNSRGEYKMLIPRNYITGNVMELSFILPDAISPEALKIGSDKRRLGVAVSSLTILKETHYKFGSKIQFGKEGNSKEYQGQGWSDPENGATWTNGDNASLLIPIKQPNSDIVLKATLSPFVTNNLKAQRVSIIVNNKKIGQWNVMASEEYQITIPRKYINSSVTELNFKLPDAKVPAKLGISADTRNLGILVKSITLSELH